MLILQAYSKAIAAILGSLIAGLVLGLDDGELTAVEWLQAVGQAVAVAGVVLAAPRNRTRAELRRKLDG